MLRRIVTCALLASFSIACASTFPEPTVEVGRVESPDGLSLAYEIRGSGSPALLFVHGWCCNRGQWRETLEEFAAEHRVVSFDLGGHGDSRGEREEWTLDAFAGDVEAVIRQLQLDDVVVVGHSMGGPVACLAAARLPELIVGVVGVETLHQAGFVFTEELVGGMIAAFESDYEGAFEQMISTSVPASAPAELTKRLVRDATATNLKVATGVLRAYPDVILADILEATPVPLICINSQASLPTTIAANTELKPDYRCYILEGTGHFPMLENPALFQAQLRVALAELREL